MKKLLYVALIALVLMFIPLAMLAQEVEPVVVFGVTIDPVTFVALLALVGGGIVTFATQLLKNALHATGTMGVVLTGVIAVLATLIYFWLIVPPLVFGKFLVYAFLMFGEATGYYHFIGPKLAKPAWKK